MRTILKFIASFFSYNFVVDNVLYVTKEKVLTRKHYQFGDLWPHSQYHVTDIFYSLKDDEIYLNEIIAKNCRTGRTRSVVKFCTANDLLIAQKLKAIDQINEEKENLCNKIYHKKKELNISKECINVPLIVMLWTQQINRLTDQCNCFDQELVKLNYHRYLNSHLMGF